MKRLALVLGALLVLAPPSGAGEALPDLSDPAGAREMFNAGAGTHRLWLFLSPT